MPTELPLRPMPADILDPSRVERELIVPLTVIYGRTSLLRRQLSRVEGLTPEDRLHFELGLAAIRESALQVGAFVDNTLSRQMEPGPANPNHPIRLV